MLLELTIRREGMRFERGQAPAPFVGSIVDLAGRSYEFKPQPELVRASGVENADERAHVCEVTDEAHVRRLLDIPGYRVFGYADPQPPAQVPREVVGQVEVVEELLPDDEEAEVPGWAVETLQLSLAELRAAIKGMTPRDIRVLIDAELADRARRKYLDALADVVDQAA